MDRRTFNKLLSAGGIAGLGRGLNLDAQQGPTPLIENKQVKWPILTILQPQDTLHCKVKTGMNDLNRALGDISSIRRQMARSTEFRGYGPATLACYGSYRGFGCSGPVALAA